MVIQGETLIVDAENRTATGRVLPVGVFVPKVQTKCDICGVFVPSGTPVLRATAMRDGAVICPSCIAQLNAGLESEWEDRNPEPALESLVKCPDCGDDRIEVVSLTAYGATYRLLGDGDYEQADGEHHPDLDKAMFIRCAECERMIWTRATYFPSI